jgi:hypothetical protein
MKMGDRVLIVKWSRILIQIKHATRRHLILDTVIQLTAYQRLVGDLTKLHQNKIIETG